MGKLRVGRTVTSDKTGGATCWYTDRYSVWLRRYGRGARVSVSGTAEFHEYKRSLYPYFNFKNLGVAEIVALRLVNRLGMNGNIIAPRSAATDILRNMREELIKLYPDAVEATDARDHDRLDEGTV